MRTTRSARTAVTTLVGAAFLVGGLSACSATGPGTFSPVASTTTTAPAPATPGVIPASQDTTSQDTTSEATTNQGTTTRGTTTRAPSSPGTKHGSGTGAGTGGGKQNGTGGGNGQGSGSGSEDEGDTPQDPGSGTPPIQCDPLPCPGSGPTKPIDPGPGDGKPKPVVRDHRGGDSDPSTASGGVVVAPSNPYGDAEVRDHRK